MNLFSRVLPGPENNHLIVLHGLFGSSDNWQTAAKNLSEHFTVHLMDMPNHGKSPAMEPFDYEAMAKAVKDTCDQIPAKKYYLLGHSMGGKAAMRFAQLYPEVLLALVVVDIGPRSYIRHHDFVFNAVNQVNLDQVSSRKEVEEIIGREIEDWTVQQFILKGLTRNSEGKYEWRTQFGILEENIDNILAAIPMEPVNTPTLFIAGGKSNYILPQDHTEILKTFPNADFKTIADAGHWVHAEKPGELAEMVTHFCFSETE